jgi:hypothetical protein
MLMDLVKPHSLYVSKKYGFVWQKSLGGRNPGRKAFPLSIAEAGFSLPVSTVMLQNHYVYKVKK